MKYDIPSFDTMWKKFKDLDTYDDRISEFMVYYNKREALVLLKDEISEKYYEAEYQIRKLINNNKPIYRGVTISNITSFVKSIKKTGRSVHNGKLRGLGIYWTYDENCANPYWGNSGKVYVLKAELNPKAVDIEGSIFSNMINAMDECEVNMKSRYKSNLLTIIREIDNKIWDINSRFYF